MRTTENLSLRLDPEVVRLARRTAEERQQTLREFFEEALRRHVTAVTGPEQRASLLTTVEDAFLQRLDQRLRDVLERVAALSAKEATDQAHTLGIVKRLLFMQTPEQQKAYQAIDTAYKEAINRVQSRGRPLPPEAVKELEDRLAAAEKLAAERAGLVSKAQQEAQRAYEEANRVKAAARNHDGIVYQLRERERELERHLKRETWVCTQLEAQSGLTLKRKTANELRQEYLRRQMEEDR